MTVLVCDLNGFKQINDRHGHLVGNQVLKAVGTALRDSCREYDYVARMGGDEFVLLLPASKRDDLRVRIAELANIGAQAAVVGLTMSVGEAFYPEDGEDAEQLLAEADRRMYTTKQAEKRQREAAAQDAELDALVLSK
jgi:diguanylate cyclase (GGDEF)-like protein